MRLHLPDLAGVGVFEQQKRGAYHLHLAVRGHYDVKVMRHHWQHVCGSGSVNIARKPGRITKLVSYLTKYLTKGMSETTAYLNRYIRTGLIPTEPTATHTGTLAELQNLFTEAYGEPLFVYATGEWQWLWMEPD